MRREGFAQILSGGDRRSIGNADQAAAMVLRKPEKFSELIECLWSADPVVRMRAANAADKVSSRQPELLRPFRAALLSLSEETTEAHLRWQLAQMIPRLSLTRAERNRFISRLRMYLSDRSSIVRTFSLQGLVDLSEGDRDLRAEITGLLEQACRSGTPAMKARSRKLLTRLHKSSAT